MASARSFPELSFAGFAGEKTDYVTGPTGTLARITNDVVTYLHPDHLGSAQAGTRANGTVAWREQYTPFGEQLQNPAANDNLDGFTGHIKDSATGLNPCIFPSENCTVQARYYDPVIGRFLSVDPVTFLDTGEPEFFNRYSYTANDPLNFTDPDGERRRGRARVHRSIAGQLRFGSFSASAREIKTFTGTPQAFSQTFTPTTTQVSAIRTQANIVRRRALNQSFENGLQHNRNGFTTIGRAFQKHSSRGQDSTFARNGETTAREFNARGAQLFKSITNRATSVQRNNKNRNIDIRTKSGSGVRIKQNENGKFEFVTFLSKSRR